MDLKLKDKVAIVTGASRGIGKTIAKKLALYGTKVAIISRKINDLEKVKDEIKSNNIICFECDISNQNQFKDIAQKISDQWGGIDILVNNAGITRDKLLLRLTESDWDDVINTNLKGYYNTIKIISRYMLKNRNGKIININSIAPGYIGTQMTDDLNQEILNNMKRNIPLNRLGTSKDVADLVCYLSSDLSSYITGQTINIDGGMTIK